MKGRHDKHARYTVETAAIYAFNCSVILNFFSCLKACLILSKQLMTFSDILLFFHSSLLVLEMMFQ